MPDEVIDYIFTDPPFGDNLMYSELNFLWEAWLRVFTNTGPEAIINKTQGKALDEYRELMTHCFTEMYRLLKPGRWITVVFHNSKASVWNAIQEALAKAGFLVAQVTVMDKQQGTIKQVTSPGAVKNDLVINAYKPRKAFEERFLQRAGYGLEQEFVAQHLGMLPVEPNLERTAQMLYSKMLAYYVQHGYEIALNADQFYRLLEDHFLERDGYWFLDEEHRVAARRFLNWMRRARGNQVARAEALPLRRDMVTLLTYVRDNRVTGTRSTGNLPLKAVREVTARFVHPPQLDTTIGDRTFRLRSEYDVWPLYFLHTLAEVGELLEGGPARRWRLAPDGAGLLTTAPLIQVWIMFVIWWKRVNWLIACPFAGIGESLPPRFEEITLAHLLSLPANTRIPFEPFADRLIQETGLKWTAPDMTYARMSLHSAIRRLVIGVLADFGVVEPEYRDKPLGRGTTRELVAFRVTSLGKGLLESLEG